VQIGEKMMKSFFLLSALFLCFISLQGRGLAEIALPELWYTGNIKGGSNHYEREFSRLRKAPEKRTCSEH
jgi:hypothetical protein